MVVLSCSAVEGILSVVRGRIPLSGTILIGRGVGGVGNDGR